ncbi:MAG TPA: hypothetical protein VHL98_07000 [Microvirga sp.]|nr:hypothetical protein [Microvirga sp.]
MRTPRRTRRPPLDGTGLWTHDAIRERYRRYCRAHHVQAPPWPQAGWLEERGWIAGVMDHLAERMKQGDLAAAEIGIEFIEEDGSFAFGRTTKCRVARALRHCRLTDGQMDRIRRRVIDMLGRGYMPREFREYARLLRRIGLGGHRAALERAAESGNAWVGWYGRYLRGEAPGKHPAWRRRGSGAGPRPWKP